MSLELKTILINNNYLRPKLSTVLKNLRFKDTKAMLSTDIHCISDILLYNIFIVNLD